jgi:hypothetical protein
VASSVQAAPTKYDPAAIVQGARVRVKPTVKEPKYSWGGVTPSDVGSVTKITGSSVKVCYCVCVCVCVCVSVCLCAYLHASAQLLHR